MGDVQEQDPCIFSSVSIDFTGRAAIDYRNGS
jgi:hypothetical protein